MGPPEQNQRCRHLGIETQKSGAFGPAKKPILLDSLKTDLRGNEASILEDRMRELDNEFRSNHQKVQSQLLSQMHSA